MTGIDDRYGPGTADQLRDVAKLCRRAERLAARSRDWYDSDPELDAPKLAAESLVLELGASVRRLPDAFLADHSPDPLWRRAIGMPHRLEHDVDAVDYELVWSVAATHAAELRRLIEGMLAEVVSTEERTATVQREETSGRLVARRTTVLTDATVKALIDEGRRVTAPDGRVGDLRRSQWSRRRDSNP